jgi:hypothetical protein
VLKGAPPEHFPSLSSAGRHAPLMRDIEAIDSEMRLVAALRQVARERGGPLPSIDVADELLDERLRARHVRYNPLRGFAQFPV